MLFWQPILHTTTSKTMITTSHIFSLTMFPDQSKESYVHNLIYAKRGDIIQPRNFLGELPPKAIEQIHLYLIVCDSVLLRAQNKVSAGSCRITDVWEKSGKLLSPQYNHFLNIYTKDYRVGDKHWLFYNLISKT